MKIFKFLTLLCIVTLISCKENKLTAQKSKVEQEGIVEMLAVTDFNAKIKYGPVQLIDVRTPREYNEGHIANAKNVNFYDPDFLTEFEQLDKTKPVYLYCRSGGRSGKASTQLRDAGFSLIYDLKGGILDWKTAGLPIKK